MKCFEINGNDSNKYHGVIDELLELIQRGI